MKITKLFVLCFVFILILFCLTITVNASLQDNGDGTVTQTRNDSSMLMWLKDTNYAKTSGYHSSGYMTGDEANSWISNLNSSNYLGYNNWRLPVINPINGINYIDTDSFNGATDMGYNISAPGSAYAGSTGSEMSYMFYTELGNLGYYDLSGGPQSGWGLNNSGPFANLNPSWYQSGTEFSDTRTRAFSFGGGIQNTVQKSSGAYGWAVRSAGVAPEPVSSTLFIVGGATLGFRRFIKKYKK